MANPPKQKGTGGETELVNALEAHGLNAARTAASSTYDIRIGPPDGGGIDALATRPDRGVWLVTIRLADFIWLLRGAYLGAHRAEPRANVEVKRYARFALHTIFEKKFGRWGNDA